MPAEPSDGAASGSAEAVPERVEARPRRLTLVCRVSAVAIVVIFTVVATALRGPTDSTSVSGVFGIGDQIAMVILGFAFAAGVLLIARPRVVADREKIDVRNIVGGYTLPWTLVRGIKFNVHSPWAALELLDDDVVPVIAVQAADKGYAVDTVRALRALHRAATSTAGSGSPTGMDGETSSAELIRPEPGADGPTGPPE
jgi:hypothetical protein